jgi:hypothetical protein
VAYFVSTQLESEPEVDTVNVEKIINKVIDKVEKE